MASSFNGSQNQGCAFCKRNKEPEAVYKTHTIKDGDGKVICPQLFKYRCSLCGSTGQDAHTRSYCPLVNSLRPQSQSQHVNQAQQQAQAQRQTNNNQDLTWRYNSFDSMTTPNFIRGAQQNSTAYNGINVARGGMFRNMGRVTNSRFNSAGRLRNPSNNNYGKC